ncbi:MAG TPA: hypothetical protein VGP72_14740 [Planctomycetota bacterium]|jgi:hypothetical protein
MAGFKMITRCNEILDDEFGSESPATLELSCFTTLPDAAGAGGVEVGASGYARLSVPNDAANWPAAADALKMNGQELVFVAPGAAAWGYIVGIGIRMPAAQGGAVRRVAVLSVPKQIIANGPALRIPIGALKIREA